MKSNLFRLTGMFLLLTLAATSHGQDGVWNVSGSIVYTDDDNDRAVAAEVGGGQFTVGRDLTDHLTVEGLLGYSVLTGYCKPGDCYPDQKLLDISANLLAFYNRDATFAPYATIGLGYLGKDSDEGPQYIKNGGTDNRPTLTAGFGFKWALGQGNFLFRGEYRLRSAYRSTPSATLSDNLVTLGVEYRFGDRSRALGVPASDKPEDTDGDGVLDMWDVCPDTPAGVEVTSRGCEIQRVEDDDDNDRVPNSRDACPNTPAGSPVDPRGCSLDSDMDGVPTDRDRCPGSRPGADVNQYGCENDRDNDGVVDHRDRCLDTRPGVEVDDNGCEIRDIISLPGVNFQTGSDLLAPGAEDLIEIAAQTLNSNPNLLIEVAGHTDSQGSDLNNLGLSDRRAKTVYDYLFLYGVDPKRMSYKGYGESQPIADNSTAEGRALNRRVELRVTRQ